MHMGKRGELNLDTCLCLPKSGVQKYTGDKQPFAPGRMREACAPVPPGAHEEAVLVIILSRHRRRHQHLRAHCSWILKGRSVTCPH